MTRKKHLRQALADATEQLQAKEQELQLAYSFSNRVYDAWGPMGALSIGYRAPIYKLAGAMQSGDHETIHAALADFDAFVDAEKLAHADNSRLGSVAALIYQEES